MVVLASHMDEAFRESYATICRTKTILVDVYRVGQASVILGWFATNLSNCGRRQFCLHPSALPPEIKTLTYF